MSVVIEQTKPRKLWEMLQLAMPLYKERVAAFNKREATAIETPGMCGCMSRVTLSCSITYEERQLFNNWIKKQLHGYSYLAHYLESAGKPYDRAARIRYYQRLINLKVKGW